MERNLIRMTKSNQPSSQSHSADTDDAPRAYPPLDWRESATLTVPEAAAVLRISRAAAYEAARQQRLPHIKIGRRILVPVSQLRALLDTGRPPA